jgi:hypothetical protein
MNKSDRKLAEAAELLVEFLEDPEVLFDGDGEDELRTVDRRAMRAVVADRLRHPFSPTEMAVLSKVLGLIGLGKAKGDLVRIVSDPSQSFDSRGGAASILLQLDPLAGVRTLSQLDPEDRQRLETYPFRMLLRSQIEYPGDSEPFTEVLLTPDRDPSPLVLFERIEPIRKGMGIFPSALYDEVVLEEEELAEVREPIITAMIEERDPGALHLFTRLLEGTQDEEERRRWRSAIMRLGTARSEHLPDSPPARAWMLAPEYLGAGGVALLIENPEGTSTLTMFQLDPELTEDTEEDRGELVFDLPEESVAAFDDESLGISVPVSPGIARALVDRYTDALGEEWFSEPDATIMTRILQAWRIRESERLPRPEPIQQLKKHDVAGLLAREPYARWILNLSGIDWDELDEQPVFTSPTKAWKRKVIELIDEDDQERRRIVRNLDWMSLFHAISGDQFSSSVAAALAREIESKGSIRVAGFAEVMIDRTVDEMDELAMARLAELEDFGEADDDFLDASLPEELDAEMEAGMVETLLPIVGKQVRDDAMPFVGEAYDRLRARGMKPEEAEAEVARVLAAEIFDSLSKDTEFDLAAYEEALSRL